MMFEIVCFAGSRAKQKQEKQIVSEHLQQSTCDVLSRSRRDVKKKYIYIYEYLHIYLFLVSAFLATSIAL